MGLTAFAVVYMFMIYCWLMGEVHWIFPTIAGTYAVLHGMLIAESIKRYANLVGWRIYDSLCFLSTVGLMGLALYIIVVS